ncbi:hypothetical protein B0186_11190 [Canicola haemoglobinophilus]|uniref:Uncharacterized protein n=1 Tax=Canicola haemoglobinophilus TaxID=733 RepID=A0A1V4AYC4_9PAST|nr:hypothetical protein [Canicola haemoglobinophilus]OOR95808.1 hypothetical protein B0186_11190 [Canicola haemoglobinophilus]STO59540.1 Uncharacterised protein [Canicola haemoglobinophilus]
MSSTELLNRLEQAENAITRLHHENELLKTWLADLMQILAENRAVDLTTTQDCINNLQEQVEESLLYKDPKFLLNAHLFIHKLRTSTLHGFCQEPTCEISNLHHKAFREYYDFCEKNKLEP